MVGGNGAHMVMFGRESCKTTELSAWTSLDGVTWTPLTFTGETSSLPTISGPICNGDDIGAYTAGSLGLSSVAVMTDGVFILGTFFATAVTN
jgi:hypothetical protein